MLRIKKFISSCLAVVMIAALIFNVNVLQISADSGYSAEIAVELQDEEGDALSAISGVNFGTTELKVTSDSITVTMVYSGRALSVLNSDGNYTNDSTAIDDEYSLYTFSVTDINERVAVSIPAGGASGGVIYRYLAFIVDDATLSKINAIYGQDDNGYDIADGTYTIETISTATDGVTPYENVKHVSPVTIAVSGGVVTAYITSNATAGSTYGGDLTFDVDYSLYSSATGYNQYQLAIGSLDTAVTIGYGAVGYSYLITFDISTLSVDTAGNTDDDDDDAYTINATHTIQIEAQNEDGSTNARNADLDSTAQLEISGDSIVAYVTSTGRELKFQNANGLQTQDTDSYFTNDIVYTNGETKIYRIVLSSLDERIYSSFSAGGASSGSAYFYLAFLADTLAVAGEELPNTNTTTDDDPQDDNTLTGVAKFTVNVEAQNEDGTINEARNQYITQEATLEVSLGSLVVYVSASERALFFDEDEDGEYTNDIVSTADGKNTYRIALTSMDQRVLTTFLTTGDNPNYSASMPIFYLAFSADDETLALIKDIYENGIAEDVNYTTDTTDTTDDDSSGSGNSNTSTTSGGSGSSGSSSGSTPKTGDETQLGQSVLILLCAGGIIAYILLLQRKKRNYLDN